MQEDAGENQIVILLFPINCALRTIWECRRMPVGYLIRIVGQLKQTCWATQHHIITPRTPRRQHHIKHHIKHHENQMTHHFIVYRCSLPGLLSGKSSEEVKDAFAAVVESEIEEKIAKLGIEQ
jgi:hypothetical protein